MNLLFTSRIITDGTVGRRRNMDSILLFREEHSGRGDFQHFMTCHVARVHKNGPVLRMSRKKPATLSKCVV
jgi:hypothetical protein